MEEEQTLELVQDGYIGSAVVEGRTIKNELINYLAISNTNDAITYLGNNTFEMIPNSQWGLNFSVGFVGCNLKIDKQYTLIVNILENTLESDFINAGESMYRCTFPKNGVYKELRSYTQIEADRNIMLHFFNNSKTGVIKFTMTLLEGDYTEENVYSLNEGLNSTQATFNNNGVITNIYEPTIKGKSWIENEVLMSLNSTDKTLPSLGSVSNGVCDTLNAITGEMILKTKEIILDVSPKTIVDMKLNGSTISNKPITVSGNTITGEVGTQVRYELKEV